MVCNEQGLIGKNMFTIDDCKLPSNASKEWSGTRADFKRKAAKMERAVAHLVKAHAEQDASEALDPNVDTQRRHEERTLATLRKNAEKLRAALATTSERTGAKGCSECPLRSQCLRNPGVTAVPQAAFFDGNVTSELPNPHCRAMREKIDSDQGRDIYAQRMGIVEPAFGHIQQRGLRRFTLRSQAKVDTQWKLYCIAHNVAKLQRYGNLIAA